MKKPKYGWSDLIGQVLAVICLTIGTADALFGLTLWSTAFSGVALGIIASCKVDRLRHDLRIVAGQKQTVDHHLKTDDRLTSQDVAASFRRAESHGGV